MSLIALRQGIRYHTSDPSRIEKRAERTPDTGDPRSFHVNSSPVPDLTQAQRNTVSELLRISQVIGDLGSRFDVAGHRLYLVGGSVRDAMLGGLGHDLDFTTSARPDETHAILRAFTPATWDIGRDFGTIGAMKKEGDKEWQIEVTTFRADAYEPGSRKPVVAFGERIEEDLVRRDFTVAVGYFNALRRLVASFAPTTS